MGRRPAGLPENLYLRAPGRPGLGRGCGGSRFGGVGNWALGAIASKHWGQENFSLATLQPIVYCNFEKLPGTYLGYNNSMTYNWKADSGDKFTLPLGLTFGRTLLLGNGDGLDLSIGAYSLAVRPDEGPVWQFKFGISYFFN